MIINIFAMLFVFGIAFVHSIFGLYSAILNVFCATAGVAVAFGFFEPVNALLLGQAGLHPSYTEPAVFVLLFVVTTSVLRVAGDILLRGNVRVPAWGDWIGGGVLGFIVGQLCVGVMLIGFFMLPWGGRVGMYQRYFRDPDNRLFSESVDIDPALRRQDERVAFWRQRVWLRSDEFAAAYFDILSNGCLRGETTFASVYPSFPDWVAWTGNTVQSESLTAPIIDDKGNGVKDGLKVASWWEQKAPLDREITRYRKDVPNYDAENPPFQPLEYKVQPGNRLIGVRLTLDRAAADRDKTNAYHRFRPTMIRLVGEIRQSDGSSETVQFVPQALGGVLKESTNVRIVEWDNNFGLPADGPASVDAYFEVPEGFQPQFVEYRRHARAALDASGAAKAAPERLAAGKPAPAGQSEGKRTGGPANFVDTIELNGTGDLTTLPFPLAGDKVRANLDVTIEGKQLASGRIQGLRSEFQTTDNLRDTNITEFKLPEGKRLFQLQAHAKKAASLPGQVLNFAGSVVSQYQAEDETGASHPLIGYYALVKRDGQPYIELAYLPDDASFRGMLDFKTSGIKKDLQDQDDAILGMLFAVPAGRKITAISSQAGRNELPNGGIQMH
jgi:hypothetical protein